jgi:carbon storage regulator
MLVLTRRAGESIIIGEGIKLTVVNIGPGRVKIGIEAPPSVRIDREEIHTRIQQEQAADVLTAVSSGTTEGRGDQATMVNSGADTGILHNRIADKLPQEAAVANDAATAAADGPSPSTASRLAKYRLPRKPR